MIVRMYPDRASGGNMPKHSLPGERYCLVGQAVGMTSSPKSTASWIVLTPTEALYTVAL